MFGFKKTRRQPIANRQSRFESLERRELFAGNILAAYNPVSRALSLNGDGLSNSAVVASCCRWRHSCHRSCNNHQWRREHIHSSAQSRDGQRQPRCRQ